MTFLSEIFPRAQRSSPGGEAARSRAPVVEMGWPRGLAFQAMALNPANAEGFDLAAVRPGREAGPPLAERMVSLGRAGAALSLVAHVALLAGLMLWSKALDEPTPPEAITIEIVAEAPTPLAEATPPSAAETPTPPVAEASPPTLAEATPPPVVETAPPVAETLPPPVEETAPVPLAEANPPPVAEAPPPPVLDESPPPVVRASPPPAAESPAPPVVEALPPPPVVAPPVPRPPPPVAVRPPPRAAAPIAKPPAPTKARAESPRRAAPVAAEPTAPSSSKQAAASAASGVEVSAYQGAVLSRIASQKRYPEAARERAPHGVAIVRFTLSAAGQLLQASLAQSAGDEALDAEALATVRRAAPFPPPPAGAPRSFSAPLSYRVR